MKAMDEGQIKLTILQLLSIQHQLGNRFDFLPVYSDLTSKLHRYLLKNMDADSLARYLQVTTLKEKAEISEDIYRGIADKEIKPEHILKLIKATIINSQWIQDDEDGRGPSVYDMLGFHSEHAQVVQ